MIKPYFETELGKLYHGNCLEILPQIDEKIVVILTDPPYGIKANKMTLGAGKKEFYRGIEWDNKKPDISLLLSIGKYHCIWGGNYFTDILPPNNHWLIWHKKNDGRSFSEAEMAWTDFALNIRIYHKHWSGEIKEHPTQKPFALMIWCLSYIEDGIVCDPFLGSGTTAIACERLNRRWIGIEISREYCDISVNRIKKEIAQYKMDLT